MQILLSILTRAIGGNSKISVTRSAGVPIQAQSDGMTYLAAAKAARGPYGIQG